MFHLQQHDRSQSFWLVSFCILTLLHLQGTSKAQPALYNEAPQLAQRVQAGELPPIDERLPTNPLVIEPWDQTGNYGGTMRSAVVGGANLWWLLVTMGYENLVRWDVEWTTVVPNVAEAYEVNATGTEFVFRLREGMRWSDGHPFSADDIMFWYEDVVMNKELFPLGPPAWMTVVTEGETAPGIVEKIDDYTLVFKFPEPNGLFLQNLATPGGSQLTIYPRHYLEQFHVNYNPEGIDALVHDAGVADWISLFEQNAPPGGRWANKDLPTLNGWMLTTAYGEGTRVVAERNPYYWKVDSDGNQLPYIDRVTYDQLENNEVLVLKTLSGEIDLIGRQVTSASNKALFIDHMSQGQYHIVEKVQSKMNTVVITLNLTHKDPVKREIFQNRDFRIGLSHAINRQEIIDLIFITQGIPYQAAPRPESPLYNEHLATQYTEYDLELANEYLDRAGYIERDAEGFRLGPDNQRITFAIEVTTGASGGAEMIDALELIQGHWRAVGIEMHIRSIDRSLFYTRKNANEHDANVWNGEGGLGAEVILDPRFYLPVSAESNYAIPWATWYNSGGLAGEEPSEAAKRQMELYDRIKMTADHRAQEALMTEILEISVDEFYAIGVSLFPQGYLIVSNDLHNVPPMFSSWTYANPGPTRPEQYFFSETE